MQISFLTVASLLLPIQIAAFYASPLKISSIRLHGNKIDTTPIDGDLTPLSNNLLIKVKEVKLLYLILALLLALNSLNRLPYRLRVVSLFPTTPRKDPLRVLWWQQVLVGTTPRLHF